MQRLSAYMMKTDNRGSLWGITQNNWAEVNFIETASEQIRGNHYHKETIELFFIVSGEIKIIIDNLHSGEHIEFEVQKGDVFIIEPYEIHTFYTKTHSQWINMLSKQLDPENPDFHAIEV
ncbi:cupin domain-containing protein [Nostoc sp. KVJ3]|uniref:cupin domain-containing protein n=1 Tax=Nostoc sp. KVJ3 TaxID=457945 RepID=UPI0022386B7A|nr:cupin domain-containing protein [Nostoc sp. KVJ3]MCW5314643.1 cupin domain-containing protein [Nostoc sp. KVJ3]